MFFLKKLFNKNLIISGAIGVGEDDRDFLIGDTSGMPVLLKQDTKIFEYNQGSSNDCTLYSAFGALSDLKNYEFSKIEINEMNELSYTRGRERGKGWYTKLGVKCVCDYWNNKFPNDPVVYYRLSLLEKEANEVMDKNYTMCVTYMGNSKYNLDYLKDAILSLRDFGKKTYGHATDMIRRKGKRYIKDSYEGRETKYCKSNIYEIQTPIEKLIPDTYYPACYLIANTKSNRVEELKRLKTMEIDINKAIEVNSKIWNQTTDKKYQDRLHNMNEHNRNKLKDVKIEFDKFD